MCLRLNFEYLIWPYLVAAILNLDVVILSSPYFTHLNKFLSQKIECVCCLLDLIKFELDVLHQLSTVQLRVKFELNLSPYLFISWAEKIWISPLYFLFFIFLF